MHSANKDLTIDEVVNEVAKYNSQWNKECHDTIEAILAALLFNNCLLLGDCNLSNSHYQQKPNALHLSP